MKRLNDIRNGQRDITVKPTEKQLRERNDAKYSESENKNNNFTVKLSIFIRLSREGPYYVIGYA
jgi:hypothetical protein